MQEESVKVSGAFRLLQRGDVKSLQQVGNRLEYGLEEGSQREPCLL